MLLRAKAKQTQLLLGETLNVSAPRRDLTSFRKGKHLCVVATSRQVLWRRPAVCPDGVQDLKLAENQ